MDYLTPREVADKLQVHPWTVRRWISLGHLGAYRIGGRLRVPEDEYYRFKREGLRTNGAAPTTNGAASAAREGATA